jgi:hypothetical protein
VSKLDYKNARSVLQEELKRLTEERERVASTLADLDRRIHALSGADEALASGQEIETIQDDPSPPTVEEPGFEITANVREILAAPFAELSAPEIRNALVSRGWRIESYANPLAVIHQILNRLAENNEIAVFPGTRGNRYRARFPRDEKKLAAARATKKARAEKQHMLAEPCHEIVRLYPGGISAKAIAWKLEEDGIDLSCYNRPSSAVAVALKGSPFVGRIEEERADAPLQGYYYPVMESITVPPGGRGILMVKVKAQS